MNVSAELTQELEQKKDRLIQIIQDYRTVLVAFSGGVDSTFLLAAARKALPRENVLAVTSVSDSLAKGEKERCQSLVSLLDTEWRVIETEEFKNPQYLSNPANRCYFCKSALYSKMIPLAKEGGYRVIVNGLNWDDLSDIRPGRQAAVESGIQSPLRDVEFKKSEIRQISRLWALPTWDCPEMPCLSSRVSFGTPVRPELLSKIDYAERSIRGLGFTVVRVRTNGQDARIEIGKDELSRAIEEPMKSAIDNAVKDAGFVQVAIDPNGYQRGSLHRSLVSERSL